MRVLKFGGTSITDAKLFLRVVKILENNAKYGQTAAVLSAPAKITNKLITIVEKAIIGKEIIDNIKEAEMIFNKLLQGLALVQPGFPLIQLKKNIEQEFIKIKYVLNNINLLGKCQDKIKASLICLGEKVVIKIMTKLLELRGHSVTVIDPVKKILAIGHYLNSTIDIYESKKRINANKIPSHHIILMAGFIAGNQQGELVILGRNSSDYSAAVLAVCLNADSYEIWTDVDGIYTCDPSYVPDAKLLKFISYMEAIELSYFGAKILHPRTICPIAQFRIPCFVKNTINPNAPGTLISVSNNKDKLSIKGISYIKNIRMLSIFISKNRSMLDVAARFFSVMSKHSISILLITQSLSENSICFYVSTKMCRYVQMAIKEEFYSELNSSIIEFAIYKKKLAIISVVGNGIYYLQNIIAKLFTALNQADINVFSIVQGYSKRSISFTVNNKDVVTGINITHQILFNEK